MNNILIAKNIDKKFSSVEVLHGVNFELRKGEVMALMGENGAGKSTLMKILAGIYNDWNGQIKIDDREVNFKNTKEAEAAGVAIIHQELNLIQELSVAENMFLGREPATFGGIVDFKKMNELAEQILNDLQFKDSVRTLVSKLRVGYQQLVEIGKALSLNARILIMDEPTSALSEKESQILFSVINKLKNQGVAIVFISHRISEVFEIADRITVLRDGKTVGVLNAKDVTRNELIKLMVNREFNQFFKKDSKPQKEIALDVKNICRIDHDKNNKAIINNISFQVRKGEILGIAGLLGAGRTELLETLFSVAPADTSGIIKLFGENLKLKCVKDAINSGIALITEDRKGNGLVMGMSIKNNMTLVSLNEIMRYNIIISGTKEKKIVKENINNLQIDAGDIDNPIESLSGGNQQKVMIAKWLMTNPKIFLLDEPTRGVDIGAKYEIYNLLTKLAEQGMAIVMASSELPELLLICDRIIVLREGELSADLGHEEATQEKILEAAAPLG